MTTFVSVACLVMVAVLWGVTNPLLKLGTEGLPKVKASSKIGQYIADIVSLLTHFKFIVPFAFNQMGSVLYLITLASTDISLAIPLSSSLTLLITGVAGQILGEAKIKKSTCIGTILILLGITLCVLDKVDGSKKL